MDEEEFEKIINDQNIPGNGTLTIENEQIEDIWIDGRYITNIEFINCSFRQCSFLSCELSDMYFDNCFFF